VSDIIYLLKKKYAITPEIVPASNTDQSGVKRKKNGAKIADKKTVATMCGLLSTETIMHMN
jgi:hypothetical protein